jgi:hypothetical protein
MRPTKNDSQTPNQMFFSNYFDLAPASLLFVTSFVPFLVERGTNLPLPSLRSLVLADGFALSAVPPWPIAPASLVFSLPFAAAVLSFLVLVLALFVPAFLGASAALLPDGAPASGIVFAPASFTLPVLGCAEAKPKESVIEAAVIVLKRSFEIFIVLLFENIDRRWSSNNAVIRPKTMLKADSCPVSRTATRELVGHPTVKPQAPITSKLRCRPLFQFQSSYPSRSLHW